MKKIQKILVVNVNWLGDVVFTAPLFRALKKEYPEALIVCMAPPRVRDVSESIREIHEFLYYDERGAHKSFVGKLKFIKELKKYNFDIAFLIHRSLTRALLVFFAGISQRVGYATKGRKPFLTHVVPSAEKRDSLHRSDYYLNIIESYGIKVEDREPCLAVAASALERINDILREQNLTTRDFLVVINPGGNWDLKRWTVSNFILLIKRLDEEFNVKVAITGSSRDVPLAQKIKGSIKAKVIDLTGKLSLKELLALFQKTDVVISADSGPLHLANSVGTCVIGIFGPTQIEITGPRGKGHANLLKYDVGCNRTACYHIGCEDNICMQAVTVNDVIGALEKARRMKCRGN